MEFSFHLTHLLIFPPLYILEFSWEDLIGRDYLLALKYLQSNENLFFFKS